MPRCLLKSVLPFVLTLCLGIIIGSAFGHRPRYSGRAVLVSSGSYYPSFHSGSCASRDAIFSGTSPVIITRKPQPVYTEEARKEHVEGSVKLSMTLRADGTVADIMPLRTLPAGLTEEAVKAAGRIEFIPATVGGHPVDVTQWVEYNFDEGEQSAVSDDN